MSESRIDWKEITPEHCSGEIRHEKLEGEPGWTTHYDIHLCESEFGTIFYSLEAFYINDDCEFGEQHIADFKSLENAKLFAELIQTKGSNLVDDIADSRLWSTNMRTNK
jgi:hypothetical protein